jgi:hypothetical protein
MRSVISSVIVAAMLVGCATASDPIDHLAADLFSTHGFWRNGLSQGIHLPETAKPEQVVEQFFKISYFEHGKVTNYTILKIRKVHIQYCEPEYTAVLVQTNFGEKIVLFRYEPKSPDLGWWNRVFDANRIYFQKKSTEPPRPPQDSFPDVISGGPALQTAAK